MRTPIVAGNWKMHGNKAFVKDLLSEFKNTLGSQNRVEVVVCPPYVFLEQASQLLSGTSIKWGAQNVFPALEGAFTGEISPLMLKDFGCHYVIIGHSERRQFFGETNQEVAKKFVIAVENGLTPILCVGETQSQRELGETHQVIVDQLLPILSQPESLLSDLVIAYEPVWAIGTGLTATPSEAQAVHEFIRKEVGKVNKSLAEKLRIIYGGSVKQSNAQALFAMPDIDGGLIGGAALNAKEFVEIVKSCN